MKTIRYNVWESNSSSSHSLTIINVNDVTPDKAKTPLVKDNVLLVGNLKDQPCCTKMGYDDEYHIINARSSYAKAALFLQHLCHYTWAEFEYSTDERFTDEEGEVILKFAVEAIKPDLCLVGVEMPDPCDCISCWDENDRTYVQKLFDDTDDLNEVKSRILAVINTIILNDDVIIQDKHESY